MKPKLGILAGGGKLPRRIADICVKENRPYCILAIEGQASAEELSGHAVVWCRIGAAAKAISFMKEHRVQEVVMAGPIKRPSLSAIHPDMKALQVIAKAGARAFGDDGMLRAVIDVIEEEGVTVIGIDSILPNLRPKAGQLGDYGPNEAARQDIERGVQVLTALSALDVGQAVVVQQGMVLGIEAAEGTDKLIERVGVLSGPGSQGVLIKLPKCGQEERVDLPTIGPRTIDLAAEAGLAGVALKADGALVIDNEETVRRSNSAGMFIFALDIP